MDQETLGRLGGWTGAILGGLIGILGAVIGSYLAIKNTKGPRERGFTVRMTIVLSMGVGLFVAGEWALPAPYKYVLIAVYIVALVFTIIYWNKRQAAIRADESKHLA